jgi:hypothetical protein
MPVHCPAITVLIPQRACRRLKGGYLRITEGVLRSWIIFAITGVMRAHKAAQADQQDRALLCSWWWPFARKILLLELEIFQVI